MGALTIALLLHGIYSYSTVVMIDKQRFEECYDLEYSHPVSVGFLLPLVRKTHRGSSFKADLHYLYSYSALDSFSF